MVPKMLNYFILFLIFVKLSQSENIIKFLANYSNYSEFYHLVNKTDELDVIRAYLSKEPLTVFVPNDEAVKLYNQSHTIEPRSFLKTHIINSPLKLKELESRSTLYPLTTNTRIFVVNDTDYFVNNAKVVNKYEFPSPLVYVYEIDRVIDVWEKFFTPLDFLQKPSLFGYNGLNFKNFNSSLTPRIREWYQSCVKCTYYIPNNIGTAHLSEEILLAHIVKDNLLFTRRMEQSKEYQTLADGDEFRVKLSKDERETLNRTYINANSTGTGKNFRRGYTRSRILYSNIITSTGLIHIIDKPFVLVDTTLQDYLNEEEEENLTHFKRFIDQFPSLQSLIKRGDPKKSLTVFAFTNEAYKRVSEDDVFKSNNKSILEDILKMHLVENATIDSKYMSSHPKNYTVSYNSNKKLTFSSRRGELFVTTNEVTAKVVVKDIITTNGIIHIINRVLGIPTNFVLDKLLEESVFNDTYTFVQASNSSMFNLLVNNSFTLFAPSDLAWYKLKSSNPSYYFQLMKGVYPFVSEKIIQRHLIDGQGLPSDQIRALGKNQTILYPICEVVITVNEFGNIYLKYRDVSARITRLDLRVKNGFIHEIDTILMDEEDMAVSLGQDTTSSFIRRYSLFFFIISLIMLHLH